MSAKPSSKYCNATGCGESILFKRKGVHFCSNVCYLRQKQKLSKTRNGRRKWFLMNENRRKKCERIAHYFLEEFVNEIND